MTRLRNRVATGRTLGPLATRGRRRLVQLAALRARGVQTRLRSLEEEVQENRRLNRRIAELTDLMTELMVPLARHDAADAQAVLNRYRDLL